MIYIKRIVMHGFKSFPKKTELIFTPEINVILGPNGSGKSNISDALCFVLGRLSIKSMRAAKAKNLIFLGTSAASPAHEASVEMVFDNSDKTFEINKDEVLIKRIVRRNGQSLYKINDETKTRQEILFLLAQAGIDPNGFNIILQGEIQNFVRMHTEDRRKILEEVSGISIYELRKEKSLRELEKTEEKLKEVLAILRERTSYLNNLEKERQQALKFKKLEADVKKFKASIIYNDMEKKKKEIERVVSEIIKRDESISKIKRSIIELQTLINNIESKIQSINSIIQKSTGFEQEKLNKEISDLRAEIAGLSVRKENFENKLNALSRKKSEVSSSINEEELSIKELNKGSSNIATQKDLEKKKKELEEFEQQRKKFYSVKTELKSVKEMIQDKENFLKRYQAESNLIIKQIEYLTNELFDRKTDDEKLNKLKADLSEKKRVLLELSKKQIELEKFSYTSEYEIKRLTKLKEDIAKIDICPLCKSKVTSEHIKSINQEINPKIEDLSKKIAHSKKSVSEIQEKINLANTEIDHINSETKKRESDFVKLSSINEKKFQIKSIQEETDNIKKEITALEKRRFSLENFFNDNLTIEQRYETTRIEVQEISIRNQENVDSEISFKQRELERLKITLKQILREELDLKEELKEINGILEESDESLAEKIYQEEELTKRFKMMIFERDSLQDLIRKNESVILIKQTEIHGIEQETNNFKIEKARFDAENENLEIEMLGFSNIEIIKTHDKNSLLEKLNKTQEILSSIGSVNLRSLEVYDSVKKEYDSIKEKVEIIEKEKQGILKIIHEIDIKKKKVFIQTLNNLNETFSRNFTQLSTKGTVSLELENPKEPFEAGIGIVVKTGHGKYFDVTSLSGGEQTLVALSLIFAIQEFKPYCFYILDEIDAALDKRNSERLAGLLRKYMQKGQYIVITHNDEIITKATNLYGVSMHDGISKIVSLKVD
ncbi:MAG: chromosome segregation SMC family protein [Nanoarchaeota archaeon]